VYRACPFCMWLARWAGSICGRALRVHIWLPNGYFRRIRTPPSSQPPLLTQELNERHNKAKEALTALYNNLISFIPSSLPIIMYKRSNSSPPGELASAAHPPSLLSFQTFPLTLIPLFLANCTQPASLPLPHLPSTLLNHASTKIDTFQAHTRTQDPKNSSSLFLPPFFLLLPKA